MTASIGRLLKRGPIAKKVARGLELGLCNRLAGIRSVTGRESLTSRGAVDGLREPARSGTDGT
jgi:hypothetical protein